MTAAQKSWGVAYAVVILTIVAGSVEIWRTERSALRAEAWVTHTYAVRGQLSEMVALCTQLEAASWEQVLTGRAPDPAAIAAERKGVDADLRELRRLTRDNPIQQRSLRRLEHLQEEQTAFQRKLVEATRTGGRDAAQKAALAGGGSRMAAIRKLIDEMIAEESSLLPDREQEVRDADLKNRWLFGAMVALAVVFLTLSHLRIHRMLREARDREARLALINTNLVEVQRLAKVGSWVWEIEPDVVEWSDALFELFQIPRGSQPPTYPEQRRLFTPESWVQLAKRVEECRTAGVPYSLELDAVRPDGTEFLVWVTGRAERGESGAIGRLMGTVQDITEAREALQRERALRKEATLALEAKGRFLAIMSHEIRTPINGILGFTDQLAENPLPPAQVECVRVIRQSGQSLLRIINDILDFSWMQSGKLAIKEAPFSPRALVESVHRLLTARGAAPRVDFTTDLPAELPARLLGDEERLRQILNNLGENALKFTAEGAVTMGVRDISEDRGEKEGVWLEFFVRDTGIGIVPGKVEEIFEPFTQAEGTIRRRFGGTGLGLSIAMQLARRMGGNMTVDSTPGRGSEFRFAVPFKVTSDEILPPVPDAEEALDADFARRHPLSIVVAEDDRINSRVVLYLLGMLGYEPVHTWNGVETLEWIREKRPQCIFMDVHMPDLDGFEATKAIRREERERDLPPIHIIALTADILPAAQQNCREAGMSDYLSKPVSLRNLAAALRRAGSPARAAAKNEALVDS